MAKHIESYLCIVCNAIVVSAYRWAGQLVAVHCGQCGREFRRVRPSPDVLAMIGPKPVKATTGDLFTDKEDHG